MTGAAWEGITGLAADALLFKVLEASSVEIQ